MRREGLPSISDFCWQPEKELSSFSIRWFRFGTLWNPNLLFFEREFFVENSSPEEEGDGIHVDQIAPHTFVISGVPVDKMLGYTNLESEKRI